MPTRHLWEEDEQDTPSFPPEVMTGLARWKYPRERMLFILCGAIGRTGRTLGQANPRAQAASKLAMLPSSVEEIVNALEIYDIEQPLGTGGMGTVHLLKNRLTGQQYACKMCILPDSADHRLFLEELRVWIDLPVHPHLAACYFFRTVRDRIVIFAEYLAGGSITDRLRRGDLETTEQMLDVAIQSARGLGALHEFGYVHGDIKPSNILLTSDGQVKVADFGLSFSRRRIPVLRRGAELYRSPEQFSGTVTTASDVWNWGLSVLEMFTREPLWSDGNAAPAALREYRQQGGKLPEKLAAVLERCFEWKPERRWASMGEIEANLLPMFQEVTGRDYVSDAPVFRSSFNFGDKPVRLHYATWRAPQEMARLDSGAKRRRWRGDRGTSRSGVTHGTGAGRSDFVQRRFERVASFDSPAP